MFSNFAFIFQIEFHIAMEITWSYWQANVTLCGIVWFPWAVQYTNIFFLLRILQRCFLGNENVSIDSSKFVIDVELLQKTKKMYEDAHNIHRFFDNIAILCIIICRLPKCSRCTLITYLGVIWRRKLIYFIKMYAITMIFSELTSRNDVFDKEASQHNSQSLILND